ncbi:MAG: response regulator, partial [Gemmatimonadaceae bacterium]|nr:response regulator [Gemmatimonadaceae bacterium]
MSKRKILVVSDETIVAQELGERLVALGYEVAIAGSQDESRAMMAASEPDLVLMDNELRGVLRAREAPDSHLRFRSIAVVLMTTEGATSSPSGAGVIEPHGHLVKPFTQRELCMTLELALCKVDAAREARAIEDRFFAVSIDMLCCLDFNGYFKRLNPA